MPPSTPDPDSSRSAEFPSEPPGTYGSARAASEPRLLPRAHRPRERILSRGARSLGHAELVALVLGSGTARRSAAAVAEHLVRRHGLEGLAALGPRELERESGVGTALAARLAAAFELGRRSRGRVEPEERPRIARPRDAWRLVKDLGSARKEHLVGLYVDAQNGLIHRETISIGALNTTRTHPREILYPAIAHLALGFLLAHNHPSGCLEPSDEDVSFTRAVARAAETVGIDLYDHIIVGRAGFTSLRERGAF
ncbi:MAG TPA: DNA repair protein RadC [Candidatus Sulfotelmatobacter sp.]|jgi:DNA repair protein RadC|nr:DNA repair protein RadC [Candidatus Sulfotelmatobacter sp.]